MGREKWGCRLSDFTRGGAKEGTNNPALRIGEGEERLERKKDDVRNLVLISVSEGKL